jgi:outer membrane protein OmpA-like peptidoglycan-associated protein
MTTFYQTYGKTALGTLSAALLSMSLLACSSMPTKTDLLEQTRNEYMAAQSDPNVTAYAPMELRFAKDALEQATKAADKRDSPEAVDRLAYIAKQKIAISQEVTKQKVAEAAVKGAGAERDQLRLAERTVEAVQAKQKAEAAQQAAVAAQAATVAAQGQAQLAQSQTADAQRQARESELRAAKLESQFADLQAKKTERGMVITLGDVLFGTDQSRLTPAGIRTTQKLAAFLQQNPSRTVSIEGFTDSTGGKDHNQQLSERRASAVRSALQVAGIARERILVQGYGEAYPVASNDTAADRQLNRRVEIVLSDENGRIAPR